MILRPSDIAPSSEVDWAKRMFTAPILVIKSKAPAPVWEQLIGAAKESGHAEKTPRVSRKSLCYAVDRVPPPSAYVLNLSEPVSLFIDFAVKRNSIGYKAVEHVVGHSRAFLRVLVFRADPGASAPSVARCHGSTPEVLSDRFGARRSFSSIRGRSAVYSADLRFSLTDFGRALL